MSLWGKTDDTAGAPKYLKSGNPTGSNLDEAFFVDTTEAGVSSNRAKSIKTPGWILYKTYTDSDGNTRHREETLVPMKVTAAVAGDEGVEANTVIEDQTVADV